MKLEKRKQKGDNCIFCKIIQKEIPADVVYETKNTLAFLDMYPAAGGHTLLIPKKHFEWMHETPDELIAELFIEAKKIMKALQRRLNADYVSLSVVGKDVPHFHIHLIPRYENDGLKSWPIKKYKSHEKEELAGMIRKEMK